MDPAIATLLGAGLILVGQAITAGATIVVALIGFFVVGHKADAAYREANHGNLKLQAVLDAGNLAAGRPVVPVTAASLTEAGG